MRIGNDVTRKGPPARVASMATLNTTRERALYERIAAILDETRGRVARTVNTAMVNAYWHIGREIVQVEQAGSDRAGYRDRVIDGLAKKLAKQFGKGFSARSLRRMRQFFLTYPRGPGCHLSSAGLRNGQRCWPNRAAGRFGQHRWPNRSRRSRRHSAGRTTFCCSPSRTPRRARSTRSRRLARTGQRASSNDRSDRSSSSDSRKAGTRSACSISRARGNESRRPRTS